MAKGRSRQNIGSCAICGCKNTSETFRKLTEKSLKITNNSPNSDLIIEALKVGDELCQKHYNNLVAFERGQVNRKRKTHNDLSYNLNTAQQSKIHKQQLLLHQVGEIGKLDPITKLKPYNSLSKTAQRNCSKKGALLFQDSVNETIPIAFHSNDKLILHETAFSINNNHYRFVYKNNENQQFNNSDKSFLQMIVCATDWERISRAAYRELAAICQNLPRECAVANMRQQINKEMNKCISTTIFNLEYTENNIVDRCKVNHVMFTFAILNDLENINKPGSHHLLILYSGVEKYDTLQIALEFLAKDLEDIKD
ncbi:13925_t:CDS:2, partial [Racocetra fulgida]